MTKQEKLDAFKAQSLITDGFEWMGDNIAAAFTDGDDTVIVTDNHGRIEKFVYHNMNIDNYLGSYHSPNTYALWAWVRSENILTRKGNRVTEEHFYAWCENNEFDEDMFIVYLKYLWNEIGTEDMTVIEDDLTLGQELAKRVAAIQFDYSRLFKELEKCFSLGMSGQGIWLVPTQTIYEDGGINTDPAGFRCDSTRPDTMPIVFYVTDYFYHPVRAKLQQAGFKLWDTEVRPCGALKPVAGSRIFLDYTICDTENKND